MNTNSNFKYTILMKLFIGLKLAGFLCFILMPLNILLYFGFYSAISSSNSENLTPNPLGFTIELIYIIHGIIGFLVTFSFDPKHWLLCGLMGLLSALTITAISYYYFGWRERVESFEVLLPLTLGTLPFKKLYDFIKRKYLN